eukprot:CAMPEP_0184664260 /NCGR_PEP_ID=MMETSP0308-20130426/51902_1 /TAXON_ID=38269 /ORGANISM="Gloeochaete witrockiana, Strain SAG 46.84" /LENGTH=63 /DNA_ID=CAMNT_0027107519 /DNA_START=74 /DNA_END=265 /DNA_ORIENTATION=+
MVVNLSCAPLEQCIGTGLEIRWPKPPPTYAQLTDLTSLGVFKTGKWTSHVGRVDRRTGNGRVT